MRLRSVKNESEKIANHPLVIAEPEKHKGQWAAYFGNDHPIWIEIGMGKGGFLAEMARLHKDINFVGFEKYSKVLARGLPLFSSDATPHVALTCFDAANISGVFEAGEIDRIFLNFSDPWPKKRHTKRRLTYQDFLVMYSDILNPKGELHLKTDNVGLFEFSLEELRANSWNIIFETRDLHHSTANEGNVRTEYEQKFAEQGQLICKLIASRTIQE